MTFFRKLTQMTMSRPLPGIEPARPAPDPLAGIDTQGLSADTYKVALAIALFWTWRTRTDVLGLLAKMGMKTREGRNFTAEGVKLALNELAKDKMLVEASARPGYFHLADTLRLPLYRQLLELRDGNEWADLLARVDNISEKSGWWYYSGAQAAGMTALLRARLAGGADADDMDALRHMVERAGGDWGELITNAVLEPFDEGLFERIADDYRWLIAEGAVQSVATVWSPRYAPVAAWAEHRLSRRPRDVPAMARWALADLALQRGNHRLFQQALDGLDGAASAALHAGMQILEGQWAAGQAAFETALKRAQKETGSRKRLFPVSIAWLYPLSLLAQGTPKHLEAARKFCLGEAGTRNPGVYDAWGAWVNAIDARLGNATLEKHAFQPRTSLERCSWRELWRVLLAAWIGPDQIATGTAKNPGKLDISLIDGLRAQFTTLGLHALLRQLDGAEAVLANREAPAGFFAGKRQEAWRDVLAALQSLGAPEAAKGNAGEAKTRLLWEITIGKQGELTGLCPLEQKRGARGWNTPKPLTLSRLAGMSELPAHDAKVTRALRPERHHAGRFNLDLAAAIGALVGHPQLFLAGHPDTFIDLVEAAPEMEVVNRNGHITLRVSPPPRPEPNGAWYVNAEDRRDAEALRLLTLIVDGPQRLRLVRYTAAQRRAAQLVSGRFALPADDQAAKAELDKTLQALAGHFQLHADAAQAARQVAAESRLRAELAPNGDALSLRLVVAPLGSEGPRLTPARGRRRMMAAIGSETVGTERDLAAEQRHLDTVIDAFPCLDTGDEAVEHCEWLIDDAEAALGLVEALPGLAAIAAVDWPKGKRVKVHAVDNRQLALQIGRERDWFRLSGGATLDEGLVLKLETLLAAAREKSRFIPIGDGVYAALTRSLKQKLSEIAAVAETDTKGGKVPTLAAAWLDEILDGTALDAGTDFRTAIARLRTAQQLAPAIPKGLQASLRPYQEDGYQWAMRLAAAGMGACLADDMGLGKTLQALAVMLARAGDGPALVIAPTSVCGNWLAEINRFAPGLSARIYSEGDDAGREAMVADAGPRDVLIVSYTLLQLASERFAARQWHTLVADEAQAIKNAAAKRSQAVFELDADFRLALSGTPVENRLAELWSIMRFANPGLLGSLTRFNERFAGPIERNRDRDAQHVLKRLIGPFVLRRTKAQVLDDLPPRTELILSVAPEAAEAAHYEALRRQAMNEIAGLAEAPAGQARFNVLAQLTRLRRAACDPRLPSPEFGIAGAKVAAFADLAVELAANGHKTLVFSQFVDFLQLLRAPLDAAGLSYQYLDGATPAAERSRRVAAFQQGEGDFFLISLKAGGFGLNLTAADYVVITDPWWNPAAEDQAMGRAHRIGQQRPVTVYRLVTKGSIEERIVDLHHDKRALAESILADGDSVALPATDDLIALIRGEAG